MAQPAQGPAEAPCPTIVLVAVALVAVLLNLFFHHLGTRTRHPAPALKSS
ncbi:hypothetical protein [Streptomyces sp. NPDC053069]